MADGNIRRYFIADIHLNESAPNITDNFVLFLKQLPNNCELYILGDLFDYWTGDDAQTPLHHYIAEQIRLLSSRNIRTFYMRGNRDFLLGKRFAKQSHMTLLPDMWTVKQGDKTVLVLHGDTLCTFDKSYLRYRRIVRNPLIQTVFLCLPLSIRRKIAHKFRETSSKHNQLKTTYKMDVNPIAVEQVMEKYNADILIHGHTHKPGHYRMTLNGKTAERFVLGAWHDDSDYVVADKSFSSLKIE